MHAARHCGRLVRPQQHPEAAAPGCCCGRWLRWRAWKPVTIVTCKKGHQSVCACMPQGIVGVVWGRSSIQRRYRPAAAAAGGFAGGSRNRRRSVQRRCGGGRGGSWRACRFVQTHKTLHARFVLLDYMQSTLQRAHCGSNRGNQPVGTIACRKLQGKGDPISC